MVAVFAAHLAKVQSVLTSRDPGILCGNCCRTHCGCVWHAQVREFEGMMAHMQPVFKPLLKPHLEDLEKKVAPGLFILTWASMNIDGYLHRFKQVWHEAGRIHTAPSH